MKKWASRKFLLMTALFIEAGIFKYQGKIGDTAWLIASAVGVFGLVVVLAWLQEKGVYNRPDSK
jgi:hypothetical protein